MTKRITYSIIVVFALFISCGKENDTTAKTADGKITLKLNLTKGDTYNLSTDMDQKIEMSMNGQEMKMDQTMKFEVSMAVSDVLSNGNMLTANTFKRFAMYQKMHGPMEMELKVDTKDDIKEGMMAETLLTQFKKMIGLTYNMEFDKTAAMASTDLSEVLAKINPGTKSSMQDVNAQAVPFPDHPVGVGDTWTGELKKDLSGTPASITSTYALKDIKDGKALIHVDGIIKKTTDNTEIGKMSGDFDVLFTSGWTNQAKIKMDMALSIEQGGQSIPMKILTDMTITSVKQ
jgi:hypothetical protein